MGKQRRKRPQGNQTAQKMDVFELQALAEQLHDRGLISDVAAFGDYRDASYVRRVTYRDRIRKLQERQL